MSTETYVLTAQIDSVYKHPIAAAIGAAWRLMMAQDEPVALKDLDKLPIGHGVWLIVDQGLLDHWFTPEHWSDIKPSIAAFQMAARFGLVERHFTGTKYRLTDLGRSIRATRSQVRA